MDQDTNNDQPQQRAAVPEPSKPAKQGFLHKTGIYGLELGVAMVTMVILATVLSFGAFALSQYIYGTASASVGQLALWSAASTIVWLPVVYIFYLRSGAYIDRNPTVVNNSVQRAFVVIYQVLMLLTVIAFSFTAVYSMLNAFVQAHDMAETLVTVSLPAFLSALIFAGAFVAFFRHPVIGRKVFATALLVVSILIVIPVILYSMVTLRATNMDTNRSADMYRLQSAVSAYYNSNGRKLPDSLSALPSSTRDGLNNAISEYQYTKKSDVEYELCATFSKDTTDKSSKTSASTYYADGSSNYYAHSTGKQCYTEKQPTYTNYYDLYNNSTKDPSSY
jgi:type II secretory pathway pseudopilin PulG